MDRYTTLHSERRPIFSDHMPTIMAWAMPLLSLMVLIFLSVLPLGALGFRLSPPVLALIGVYFWSVNRPEHLPMTVLFGLGVLQDLLWGGPVGLWPMGFMLTALLTRALQAPFRVEGISVHWIGFIYVAALVGAAVWLIACMYHAQILNAGPVASQFLLTVALYPVIGRLLKIVHRQSIKGT